MALRERSLAEVRAIFQSEPRFGLHSRGYVFGVDKVESNVAVRPAEATGQR